MKKNKVKVSSQLFKPVFGTKLTAVGAHVLHDSYGMEFQCNDGAVDHISYPDTEPKT